MKKIRYIDLFAGIGGTRIGFSNACKNHGIDSECVFTSEIKDHAINVYKHNFSDDQHNVSGDIAKYSTDEIPDFDILLAGFPCQPFSSAGNRRGFMDTRGTLFFEIERILRDKKPKGFLLENVEGLVNHDKENSTDKIGRTLTTILGKLTEMGYLVDWRVLNSSNFGVPQQRKRIYIVGTLNTKVDLEFKNPKNAVLEDILEKGLPVSNSKFVDKLLQNFEVKDLYGKAIKDKRGGDDNIHSWDINLKGETSPEQRKLLNRLLKERRKKQWAQIKGIDWMDGMPLTLSEIETFATTQFFGKEVSLKSLLDDLVTKGYLVLEHPKAMIKKTNENGVTFSFREQDITKEKGYNIVAGKLSFEISKILDPKDIAPTLVATDVEKMAVVDSNGLRRISVREGLRLFGFPEHFEMPVSRRHAYDLLGNTVVVPVIEEVSNRLVKALS